MTTPQKSPQKLPIGIQDFGEVVTGGYVYVDKTRYLYNLATQGKPYFLSRPRRFGKSLLVSTFESLFLAKRELFKGLWIDSAASDWDWQQYPVIRLDMSVMNNQTADMFERALINKLQEIAASHEVSIAGESAADHLASLIKQLSAINKVVVLIDEYDKPLIDRIQDLPVAEAIRDILRQFYGILKAADQYLQFVLLTGVTKFSKVSVFSGLNNLNDLTMLQDYSALLGYTRDELEKYFDYEISELATSQAITKRQMYDKLKLWYNGYRFSSYGELVYNPFSILRLFNAKEFAPHWFETGTPTFLIKLLAERQFDFINIEQFEVSADSFSTFDIDYLPTLSLLYQTGYLTITDYDEQLGVYKLGFPNREVSQAFTESLLKYFANEKAASINFLTQLCRNLLQPIWQQDEFFKLLNKILGLIPYDLYLKQEKHYHSLFYLIFKLAGVKINAEVHTHQGRADAIMELDDKIIIFECKLNQSAATAVKQIKQNAYYKSYADKKLPIYLVGINFDDSSKDVADWQVELV